MAGDAEATRQRLLEAASEEFSRYGIAGARVDRIAERAKSNKAQIYHYYGSKDLLFDAVFNELVAETVRESPIDATDLPGYAGTLFDRYERHPQVARLAAWYRLERAGTERPLDAVVRSNEKKIKAIAEAQRAGHIPKRFAPADLLALVLTVAAMWSALTPEMSLVANKNSVAHRRKVVTDAVEAMLGE